jgi:hypothetical protein
MMPENDHTCTCMCTPCAEFAGCAACPDCADGCDACGYPHREVDVTPGAAARTIEAIAARSSPALFEELWNVYGAPKPTPGGPTGFAAGSMLIDDPGPDDWRCP